MSIKVTRETSLEKAIVELQAFLHADVDATLFDYRGVRRFAKSNAVVFILGFRGVVETHILPSYRIANASENENDWRRLKQGIYHWIVETSCSYAAARLLNPHELVDRVQQLKVKHGESKCAFEILTGKQCAIPVLNAGAHYCALHSGDEQLASVA